MVQSRIWVRAFADVRAQVRKRCTLFLILAAATLGATTPNPPPPITASLTHWLVTAAGQVCADGGNQFGQLGDGTQVNRLAPIVVIPSGFASVSTGFYHTVAIKGDGTVWTWGDNTYGALGNGGTFGSDTPFQIAASSLSGATAVAAGQYYSLAVKSDGTVWAWGYNGFGNLGDGTTINRTVPTQLTSLGNIVSVAASGYSSLALKNDGTVWGWGYNGDGEVGDGTTTNRLVPTQVPGLSNVIAIAAGEYHSLALKNDGTLWSWGYNAYGEVGDGTRLTDVTPVQVVGLTSVVAVAGGQYHSVAIKADGTVWAWGNNTSGQLGNGGTSNQSAPVQVPGFTNAAAAAAGSLSTAVLKTDGSIWTWGDNGDGELGNGSTNPSAVPVQASACNSAATGTTKLSSTAKLIAASQNFNLAVKADGTVESWGQNQYGQLGDGTTTNRTSPVAVQNLSNVMSVAAGWSFSLALKNDGTVWAWGDDGESELGDSAHTAQLSPIQVPNLSAIVAVAAGEYHALALKQDGTVWAWGFNGNGQLGDGTTLERGSPVQVSGLSNVIAIAAGATHSLAIRNDGAVWGWGYNQDGELGDGSAGNVRTTPVQMSGMTGALAIAAGQYHTLVLRNDGTVWACGNNANGQLGDGANNSEVTIVRASGLTNVTDIAAGQNFSLAVKNNGTVWSWGSNASGQLGIGNVTNQNTPTQVLVTNGFANILTVAAGASHSLGLRADGVIFAWGDNTYGQFGEAAPAQSAAPLVSPVTGVGPFYTVTLVIAPPGSGSVSVSPTTSDGYYLPNTRVCLTESPATGYSFYSWSGVSPDSSNCFVIGSNVTVTANFAPSLRFVPVTPCRVADTRIVGNLLGGIVSGGTTRSFTISSGACSIPSSAQAYALNVTVVPTGQLGFMTVWPAGQPQPKTSTITSDGRIKANAAIVGAGTGGAVDVFATDSTDVILDINGYFVPANTSSALAFYPVTPCRIADTRQAAGSLGGPALSAGQDRTFPVQASSCGLPASAQAYSLNFTAIPRKALSYLTVWPTGENQPLVSTLNDPTGTTVANAAIMPAGNGGSVDVFATDQTDLLIDVNGYFAPAAAGGLSLYTTAPCRALDTRQASNSQSFTGAITIDLATGPCALPASAQAIVANATVVPPGALSFLTLWATGQPQPGVNTLSALDGAITSNMAIVPANAASINAFASNPTQLILDISGYFAP